MRLLPDTLFGRLALVIAASLIMVQLLSVAILLRDRRAELLGQQDAERARRVVTVWRVLNPLPAAQRAAASAPLQDGQFRISLRGARLSPPAGAYVAEGEAERRQLLDRIQAELPQRPWFVEWLELAGMQPAANSNPPAAAPTAPTQHGWGNPIPDPRPWSERGPAPGGQMPGGTAPSSGVSPGRGQYVYVQTPFDDGQWLVVTFPVSRPPISTGQWLVVFGLLLGSSLVLALWAVRALMRPLRRLTRRAEELGNDINAPPLATSGPREVRAAAAAFNQMQGQVLKLLHERNRMLSAVSHDLKTPITRMRLRSEFVEDDSIRQKLGADLDEMAALVHEALRFLKNDQDSEPISAINLRTLLDTLVTEQREQGHAVELSGVDHAPYQGRPLALRRCVGNLLGNALKYGERAEITLKHTANGWVISITDVGPGIPAAQLEQVFEPFYRLDTARSSGGGHGLGLGIARHIARSHGGDVRLKNNEAGGLTALVILPEVTAAPTDA